MSPKLQNMVAVGAGVLTIIIIAVVIYGGWQLERWAHYKFSYQAQVEQTVCTMVKPEDLINPESCK